MKTTLLQIIILLFVGGHTIGQIPTALDNILDGHTYDYFQFKSTRGLAAVVYSEDYDDYGYYTQGYSHEELGSQIPINSNMKFSLGSNGKLITSATLLKLQELGSLDLDDPIETYLPNLSVNIDGQITIRQLLNHTSGLADYINNAALVAMNNDYNQVWTPTQIVQNFVGTPPNSPGVSWSYCNTNYLLSGMIIEAVTSEPYHVAVRNLILTPNNLDEIELMGFETITGELAHAWDHGAVTYTNGDITNLPFTSPGCFGYSAGGYWGRPQDMINFYKALFIDETMLSAASLTELKTTINTPAPYNTIMGNYGLGAFVGTIQGMDVVQHTGSWWQLSAIATDTGKNNIAIVCINDTEGLSTSVNYQALAIELLKSMGENSLGVPTNDLDDNLTILRDGDRYYFKEQLPSFQVYDMLGNKVFDKKQTAEFNMSGQPKGIYYVATENNMIKVPYFY